MDVYAPQPPLSMPINTRRSCLRKETSRAHEALDHLIGPFESVAAYARYIRGMYRFRAPLEHRLATARWQEFFGAWRPQSIEPALRADLADFGINPPAPLCDAAAVDTTEALLGAAYVLEGSALGARVLYRRAREIGLDEHKGARHLALQSTGSEHWRQFLAVLEQNRPIDMTAVVASANATFLAARRAFADLQDADRQPA